MGHTPYEPMGFDADGILGWSVIALYDDFAEDAWDLKQGLPRGRVYNKG